MSLRRRSAQLERWIEGPALPATPKGRLGLALFLVSLGTLFLAAMAAYGVQQHGAVEYSALYGHFLAGVWLLLFTLMVLC